jgi:hypothetical protein
MGECSYVYEYLCLYCVSKKTFPELLIVCHLRAEVELEDATVGEEEVIQGQEEDLAYDHIQRSQGLRNL